MSPIRFAAALGALALSLFSPERAQSDVYSWTTQSGGSYTDGNNWYHLDPDTGFSVHGAPSPGDSIEFPIGGTYTVTMTGQSAAETTLSNGTVTFNLSGNFDAGSMTAYNSTLNVTGSGGLSASALTLNTGPGPFVLNVQDGSTVKIPAAVQYLDMNISGGSSYQGAGLTSSQVTVDGAGSSLQNTGTFSGVSLGLSNHATCKNGSTGTVTEITLKGQSSLDTGALTAGGTDGYSVINVRQGSTLTSSSAVLASASAFDDPLAQVTIDGPGSTWNVAGLIQLAVASGNEADLTLQNGGRLQAGSMDLGVNASGGNSDRPDLSANALFYLLSKSSASIDGLFRLGVDGTGVLSVSPGCQLTVGGDLQIGSTNTAELDIGGVASVTGDIDLGIKNGGTGSIAVIGSVAKLTAPSATLTVGDLGDGNLDIESGAQFSVASAEVAVGFDSECNIGVADAKTKWSITGDLVLGEKGDVAMKIETGAAVSCNSATLASNVGFSSLLLTGKGSTFITAKDLTVGSAGTGVFLVQEGSHAKVGGDNLTVAEGGDASGLLSVGGKGSVLDASHAQINAGGSNQGFLEVLAGGTLHTASAEIGFEPNGDAVAAVSGKGSLWTVNGNLVVGVNGTGVVIVSEGGKIISGPVTIGPHGTMEGSSTITGSVANSGTVSPSTPVATGIPDPPTTPGPMLQHQVAASAPPAPGTLTIQGNYTQTATGILNIDLGAPSATDVLAVTGKIVLGGTLNVNLAPGFVSDGAQSFTILKGASITGTFATVNGAEVTYGPRGVTVKPKLTSSTLTVSVSPTAGGSLTPGFLGTSDRLVGVTYTVTAKPTAGYLFYNWSGGIDSSNPTLTFSMQPDLQLQANFLVNKFAPLAGSYRGLGVSTANGGYADGLLTLTLLGSGNFTAKFQLGGHAYAFKGRFDAAGNFNSSTISAGQSITLALSVDLTGGTDKVSGAIGMLGESYSVDADRATFRARTDAAPEAGRYTLLFPADSNQAASPQGFGWAIVSINSGGNVTLAGHLADGATLNASGSLAKDGSFDLLASLYGSRGLVAGELKFPTAPGTTVTGSLIWNRPIVPGSPAFSTTLTPIGSIYVAPAKNMRILPQLDSNGDATLQFSGAAISGTLTKQITISLKNVVTYPNPSGPADRLSLTFATSNGTFTGSFLDPGAGKMEKFIGVVLQTQGVGGGYFLDPNGTGKISLQGQ